MLTRGNLFCLLITLENSYDPNQAWQNVGTDLDPNFIPESLFLENVDF